MDAANVPLSELVTSTLSKGLATFAHILDKAEEHARAAGLDADEAFVQARLVEDQLPLAFQVQNATKAVQLALGRLSGVEPALFANTEKTLAELRLRIQRAADLIVAVRPTDLIGHEVDVVEVPFAGTTEILTAKAAVLTHSLPNFFFHLSMGYAILRAKGVPLGKADFLGGFLALS